MSAHAVSHDEQAASRLACTRLFFTRQSPEILVLRAHFSHVGAKARANDETTIENGAGRLICHLDGFLLRRTAADYTLFISVRKASARRLRDGLRNDSDGRIAYSRGA